MTNKMQIPFFIAKYIELYKLAREVKTATRPLPPNLISVDSFRAIWEVPMPGQASRFMSVKSGAINDEFFVVRVDTEAFYYTWLKSSPAICERHGADCILRVNMPTDRKYKDAVEGFASGKENPVPLAHVEAYMDKNHARISFINGVTRSFWLIANRAPSFPVEVYGRKSAELLNQVVGLDAAPMSFNELFHTSKLEDISNERQPIQSKSVKSTGIRNTQSEQNTFQSGNGAGGTGSGENGVRVESTGDGNRGTVITDSQTIGITGVSHVVDDGIRARDNVRIGSIGGGESGGSGGDDTGRNSSVTGSDSILNLVKKLT